MFFDNLKYAVEICKLNWIQKLLIALDRPTGALVGNYYREIEYYQAVGVLCGTIAGLVVLALAVVILLGTVVILKTAVREYRGGRLQTNKDTK